MGHISHCKQWEDANLRLSSVYLYEKIKEKYTISGKGNLSGLDGYLRPFLCCSMPKAGASLQGGLRGGHVYIAQGCASTWQLPSDVRKKDIFWIFCGPQDAIEKKEDDKGGKGPWLFVDLESQEEITGLMNDLQEIFDAAEEWESKLHELMVMRVNMDRLLQVTAEFLQNPIMVMSLDFTFAAEAGGGILPPRARLYTEDGLNVEYVNALLQNEICRKMADSREYVMFPASVSGCPSLNRNLFVERKATHRLVLTQYQKEITEGVICVLEVLAEKLEFYLAHDPGEEEPDRGLEQIFMRVMSDRTADYILVSRELGELGWSGNHEYMCLLLQITYLNQQTLSTRAICRYIRKQFPDSVSFLYQEEIVTFFNLTRLGMDQEKVAGRLVYFLRDTYLKAGYSRVMEGHMNLRRQYIQAKAALDVGSRKKPYLWIHYFDQVALTFILEQSTRRLPGTMICHKGVLELKKQDEKNQTQYIETLKAYLEQHLSATQAARELFIHRSTFLYRLDRIKEILQSDMDDPEEIFYLELSLRLLEQEEEKE